MAGVLDDDTTLPRCRLKCIRVSTGHHSPEPPRTHSAHVCFFGTTSYRNEPTIQCNDSLLVLDDGELETWATFVNYAL